MSCLSHKSGTNHSHSHCGHRSQHRVHDTYQIRLNSFQAGKEFSVVLQRKGLKAQIAGLYGERIAEGVHHHQNHGDHIDSKHRPGSYMSQKIKHRLADLLFLQFCLSFGHRHIISVLLNPAEYSQKQDGGQS